LKVTEQGQITERYTKAIEQLGSDKLDVRLGGIYALERIAKDSKRDHPTVVEVLSAFVREHGDPTHSDSEPSVAEVLSSFLSFLRGDSEPADERQPHAKGSPHDNLDVPESTRRYEPYSTWASRQPAKKPTPTTDVRAALTVLGRLPLLRDVPRADLSNAPFVGANLSRMNLSGFRLMGADLREAILQGAWANGKTAWPDGFDWQAARVVMKSDEPTG
jgi:hypothetical protein